VVESSLGIPTSCAGKLRWQTAGIFGEAAMAEPWDGVGKAAMAGTHKAQEGASGWVAVELSTRLLTAQHKIETLSAQLRNADTTIRGYRRMVEG
jgi:hypothetical protein